MLAKEGNAMANEKIDPSVLNEEYKYGFTTDIDTDYIPAGLNEDTIRLISEKKGEPDWLLEFRLKAYNQWKKMEMPHWPHLDLPELDYQAIKYAEGVITDDDYAPIKAQRQAWRDEINALEAELGIA